MFDWDEAKNKILKHKRDISFEEVIFWIKNDSLLKIGDHFRPLNRAVIE
jgi:uncharacterized DUF497 family protein